jgi:hypothetical protein
MSGLDPALLVAGAIGNRSRYGSEIASAIQNLI